MSHGLPGSGRQGEPDALVLTRIASRTDLPQRARMLLSATLDMCRKHLADTLNNTLEEFQKHLFKLSEVSRNNDQQQDYFLSARELNKVRSQIIPRFLDVMEDFLAGYDKRFRTAGAEATPAGARESLSLVETGELEESLALQEFVARSEVRYSQPLYSLGHRFAVLVALPALDAQALPVGPAQLGRALRHASAVLAISPSHRVLLYRTFDQFAARDLNALYDALNGYFVEQHILKHLRAQTTRTRKAAAGSTDGANKADEVAADEAADTPNPEPASIAASGTSPSRGHGRGPQTAHASPGSPAAQAGGDSSWYDPQSLADDRDTELFATLRDLLAGSRGGSSRGAFASSPAGSRGDGIPANAYVPSTEDVQGVLGALQSKNAAPLEFGGESHERSIGELKQDLLRQLRELSPNREPAHLAPEDSDTIDLVGMLFDHMSSDMPTQGGTRHLLTRLQVPMMRVALRDKSFFTRKTHPARQLLNAVAETGERWMDGSDSAADGDLMNKLQLLLDRLATEFDGDLGVIEDLLGDLSEHVQTMTRKAEVAERRQVDAAMGREKLALAREAASNAMADRIMANPPGPFVKTLLEQAWSDVLALTLLRQGESSPAYKKRIEVADRLIESSAAAQKGEVAAQPAEDLREEIETGLSQVGYHEEDIQAVVKRLFVTEGAANEDLIDDSELAVKLASKTRLGGEDKAIEEKPLEAAAKRREALQLSAVEKNTLEELKKLPFGSWFDFVVNQQGDRVRKKMAWASKLTGRCMFVNKRGTRTDDTTLEELARDMARGQVFLARDESDTFVDRAWGALVNSLKRIGGAFAPPPVEPI